MLNDLRSGGLLPAEAQEIRFRFQLMGILSNGGRDARRTAGETPALPGANL